MTARELRKKFLEFFQSKGHELYPSGSLVPYDVTGRIDDSLLFNGAGMVQFKPFFRGIAQPPSKRLTNSQKCVRTGDIESVGDLNHLTFFEMLGNFSFGDYFKKGAIDYSWEFLTSSSWLGLDPNRLAFTVFSEDDDSFQHWCDHLSASGIDPTHRVFRLGEDTNYWPAGAFSNGPPGPCGPNSEMFYWTHTDSPPPKGAYTREDYLRDDVQGKWLEIWNDVFIQFDWKGRLRNPERPFEGYVKEDMPALPFQSVDTGMGLERTTTVLSGLRSVYQTDLFAPILEVISSVSEGKGRLSGDGTGDTSEDRATRIIADHARTAAFCIADGILPGAAGRGYVLRRLIRRAVLKGQRILGLDKPFFFRVFDGVVEAMSDYYPELIERKASIVATLESEEVLFRRTLASGSAMLGERINALKSGDTKVLGGGDAFRLYDTFGFPLEVTREICDEAGVEVDEAGYELALKDAQDRSRGASGLGNVYGGVMLRFNFDGQATATEFAGYSQHELRARIVGILPVADEFGNVGQDVVVALDSTPFYAESGGQQADIGVIEGNGFAINVEDVTKQDGVYVHLGTLQFPALDIANKSIEDATTMLNERLFNQTVNARIDASRRVRITRNHTATHLLHAALRRVLGSHVTQAGSLVAPDHLRFDFSHSQALSQGQLSEVEAMVNHVALATVPVITHENIPLDAARSMGAMALFGEKYSDFVRVVQVGDFSIELCGGVHVSQTSEIGLFKILHESSAASGIRRIEAITGEAAYEWVRGTAETVKTAAQKLKSTPSDLIGAIDRLVEQVKEERRKLEKLRSGAISDSDVREESFGSVKFVVHNVGDGDAKEASLVADRLTDNQPSRVVLVVATANNQLLFVCKVGDEALKAGAHAGNLVRAAAAIAGGGGGGKPNYATAGGKDPTKLEAAVEGARNTLKSALGVPSN